LSPWGFKAFVPKEKYVAPSPFITKFIPGHDFRILSTTMTGEKIRVEFHFSEDMDCSSITNSLTAKSRALENRTARFDLDSISCQTMAATDAATWTGALPDIYNYSIVLTNVLHGVHELTVNNVSNKDGSRKTNVSASGIFGLTAC
jgi:alpha-1,3-glucan synthase